MSQVLALKAGTKRPFDDMAIDQPSAACSPHRISFLAPPASKRLRTGHYSVPAHDNRVANNMNGGGENGVNEVMKGLSKEEAEEMIRYIPKRLRKAVAQAVARGGVGNEKLFTIDDVREIAANVAAEREEKVRREFEAVLQDRLTDQWKVFTKYHEDFVARCYRGRELTYLS